MTIKFEIGDIVVNGVNETHPNPIPAKIRDIYNNGDLRLESVCGGCVRFEPQHSKIRLATKDEIMRSLSKNTENKKKLSSMMANGRNTVEALSKGQKSADMYERR